MGTSTPPPILRLLGHKLERSLLVGGLENPEFFSRSLEAKGSKACSQAWPSFCMVPGGGQAPCRPALDLRILRPLGCCVTPCGCSATLGAGTADGGQLVNLICRQSSRELHACTARLICSSSQSTLQLACEEALLKVTVLLWLNSRMVVFRVIYCDCTVVQLAPGFNSQIFSRTYARSSPVP